jgi:DNA-binding transcriptional LysR family regulator
MADRRLQVFYTVARQLSFTRAAEQLCMTQPAVTFQIKQLEEHFDSRLFERDPGAPSAAGMAPLHCWASANCKGQVWRSAQA